MRAFPPSPFSPRLLAAALAASLGLLACLPVQAQGRGQRTGDWIAAVVNQELVTAGEVDRRVANAQAEAQRQGQRLPSEEELRRQVLDVLIEERAIISFARESGMRVDEPEIDRAVQSVASQNQLSVPALRERLRAEGIDYGRFRSQLRDQLMVERMREREVYRRIQITDEDIDKLLQERRAAMQGDAELNIAQILLPVPEGADAAAEAAIRAQAQAALQRVRAGEDFLAVARELSADANRERGGVIGMRPLNRLPDLFVAAAKDLPAGTVAPELVRSGAGFHVLKVVERLEPGDLRIRQTRARHILLRPSPQLSAELAAQRLAEYRREIETGARNFEDVARQHSEDGSAAAGGDLGWASPGTMVPEFEEAMDALQPGGLSNPVLSRFGVHLIQVLDRRDVPVEPRALREQARNILREQRFETAYADWVREMRSRAYIEMRESPF